MRSRENQHVIYVLLFLEAAFFIFHRQDPQRFVEMFAFIPSAIFDGEIWRLVTYQFMPRVFFGSEILGVLFAVLILYIMGNAMEENWGTADFVTFWALSLLGSATVGFVLGAPLLGSTFSTCLLFAYAATYPEMVFYLVIIPVKVKWLAWFAIGLLILGFPSSPAYSLAVAGGSALSFTYFWRRHGRYTGTRITPRLRRKKGPLVQVDPAVVANDANRAEKNLVLYREVQESLASGNQEAIDSMLERLDREKTPNVNICPPADFKPLAEDRFCAKCEGFAECSARLMRASTAGEADDRQASGRG